MVPTKSCACTTHEASNSVPRVDSHGEFDLYLPVAKMMACHRFSRISAVFVAPQQVMLVFFEAEKYNSATIECFFCDIADNIVLIGMRSASQNTKRQGVNRYSFVLVPPNKQSIEIARS